MKSPGMVKGVRAEQRVRAGKGQEPLWKGRQTLAITSTPEGLTPDTEDRGCLGSGDLWGAPQILPDLGFLKRCFLLVGQ